MTGFRDPMDGLADVDVRVLDAVRRVGPQAPGKIARAAGTSAPRAGRALRELQQRGLTQPAIPARAPLWWQAIPVPSTPVDEPVVATGQMWLRNSGSSNQEYIVITSGQRNEFGCWSGVRVDAEDTRPRIWIPSHLLALDYRLERRPDGAVTAWSSQFSCPMHGECTDQMVKTDKTCALCGSLLNRHHVSGVTTSHQDR